MILNEIFNTQLKVSWPTDTRAMFMINNKKYVVNFSFEEESIFDTVGTESPHYEVSFYYVQHPHDRSTSATNINNKGDAFVVFSTVGRIIYEFVKNNEVDRLEFTAYDKSRQSLYTRMLPVLLNKLPGWKFKTYRGGRVMAYIVYNDTTADWENSAMGYEAGTQSKHKENNIQNASPPASGTSALR